MTKMHQVYGGSLYELAKEEGLTEKIFRQLQQIVDVFDENPHYWQFLNTRSISKQDRCRALDEALAGTEPYLLNFIKILCENGMIMQLKGCAKEYRRRYNHDHNIVEVRATTAVPMGDVLLAKLQGKLETVLSQKVELTCRVDPACVGGVLLELPGRQLDGTVRHRLEDLQQTLRAAAL